MRVSEEWFEAVARAKVNLRLRIFPPGADGYHHIETLFCRIDLADRLRLRLREEPGIDLRISGVENVPAGRENLATRAAERFMGSFGVEGGVVMELLKRIPPGSGLGGGSSDAAAVLTLLATATGRGERTDLLHLAATLGADVPFFMVDTPLAWAWGRGDRTLVLPPPAARPMLLLVPQGGISTTVAYESWDRSSRAMRSRPAVALALEDLMDWSGIAILAVNDFEPVVFEMSPSLGELKERLLETGPSLALLSGSGSALFGVYEDEAERDAAAVALRGRLAGVRVISVSGPV
jgi:4-diphosphocytidyl-2-C-methyl-D-erythritol kinase